MQKGKVSVIITTYNYAHYLPYAIESALAQTYSGPLEIIVVDDESTDNTSEVVGKFKDKVKYYRVNHGRQGRAANIGVSKSDGEYIAMLDADDIWEPNKIEQQVLLLERKPEVGVVYTQRSWMDPQGQLLSREPRPLFRGQILPDIFYDNVICYSSAVIRRSVWELIGGIDESLIDGMDYELWLRLATVTQFDYCDKPLVRYRCGHSNMSQNKERRFTLALQIMESFVQSHPGLLSKKLINKAYADTYINWAFYLRDEDYRRALGMYVAALRKRPFYPKIYRALVMLQIRQWMSLGYTFFTLF